MKQYCCILVAGLALAMPLSTAAQESRSEWVGLWRLVQQTDAGPVTFRLFVPSQGEPQFFGSSWENLYLAGSRLGPGSLELNWQTKGVNIVFRGRRQGAEVSGDWELVHPQYRQSKPFEGRRLLETGQWKPLQGLRGGDPGVFLNLNSRLLEHRSDLAVYWRDTFYPGFLPLVEDPPTMARLTAKVGSESFEQDTKKFAAIVQDLESRLRRKAQGLEMPYTFVAAPFGPAEPQPVQVHRRAFLLVDPSAMLARHGEDAEAAIPRELLESSFERHYFTVQIPAMRQFRKGLPAYLLSQLYSGPAGALGLPATRLEQLEKELDAIKQRARNGKAPDGDEGAFLAYRFVSFLARSRTPPQLLELDPRTLRLQYAAFLNDPA